MYELMYFDFFVDSICLKGTFTALPYHKHVYKESVEP